jgi:hypothetical protein
MHTGAGKPVPPECLTSVTKEMMGRNVTILLENGVRGWLVDFPVPCSSEEAH